MTPSTATTVLILGASARAAAFSALRAGLAPRCVDLFADLDLAARCPVRRLEGHYPQGFAAALQDEPPGPWLYTGGLENWPALVERLTRERPLWGNDGPALRRSRDPFRVAALLREAGLPVPRVVRPGRAATVPAGRWLVKPVRGAGGSGIRPLRPGEKFPPDLGRRLYLQEWLEGESAAALFLGDGERTWLLGLTRQLVGETWLGAGPYRYCGSIGPLPTHASLRWALARLGRVLAEGCGLRGLFGVDGVLREDGFWPVEVNPRYTASVEVVEHACGIAALGQHARLFTVGTSPADRPPVSPLGVVGKAIVFARRAIAFPPSGPWEDMRVGPRSVSELPPFADIPAARTAVEAGQPVLTVLVPGASPDACHRELRRRVAEVERWLYRDGARSKHRGEP